MPRAHAQVRRRQPHATAVPHGGTRVAAPSGIMDADKKHDVQEEPEPEIRSDRPSAGEIAVEALVGAAAGATTGLLAGPPGIVAGAVIGGAIGAAAGAALHRDHLRLDAKDAQLDRDIGVIGGNLGEAPPNAPKPRRGAFHATSLGVAAPATSTPSEGMMQNVDED
jgi:hypothetical protein